MPERQLLTAHGAPAPVGGRALDILVALVERCGELVSKRDLIARAWPDTFVDESNLKVNIAALRKVLGEPADDARYIATVTGRGYRFVAPVERAGQELSEHPRVHADAPAPSRSDLIGRGGQIDVLCADLEVSRLVSIVGPGGVGKTTVAVAVAERMGREGALVRAVDVASLRAPAQAPQAIAAAVPVGPPEPRRGLQGRRTLLMIDGCEHFTEAVAACVDQILAASADVTVLAAGREPLRVRGERVHRLKTLEAPPASRHSSATQVMAFPAVQLFAACAQRRRRAFQVDDSNAVAVGELCRRLDGLPLAIELAAAHVEAFGECELLDLLAHPFQLLNGARAGPERHRSLAASLGWSFDHLSEDERAIMERLARFDRAFDLEEARREIGEVCDRARSIEHLANLVAKSLVLAERQGGVSLYRLLEMTRAYARAGLRPEPTWPSPSVLGGERRSAA